MNYIGKKSLASFLASSLNIIWWMEWIAGLGCIVLLFSTAFIRKVFALQIPVNFQDISIRKISAYIGNSNVSILNVTHGTLSVHVDAGWENITLIIFGYGAIFAVLSIITYQVKNIFASVAHNQPFHKLNMRRLKTIALALIFYSFFQCIFVVLLNHVLQSKFKFEKLSLSYDFNFSFVVIGLVILVLKGIFEMGLALEEDNKLTI